MRSKLVSRASPSRPRSDRLSERETARHAGLQCRGSVLSPGGHYRFFGGRDCTLQIDSFHRLFTTLTWESFSCFLLERQEPLLPEAIVSVF